MVFIRKTFGIFQLTLLTWGYLHSWKLNSSLSARKPASRAPKRKLSGLLSIHFSGAFVEGYRFYGKTSGKRTEDSDLQLNLLEALLGGGNSNIFYVHPYLGKIPILTFAYFFRWVGSTTNFSISAPWFFFGFTTGDLWNAFIRDPGKSSQ